MALTIVQNNGTFNITGKMNTDTSEFLKSHIQFLLNTYQQLTLNIDGVTEIDTSGMLVLRLLYEHALINNKDLFIVGYGCKEIYDDFRSNHVA